MSLLLAVDIGTTALELALISDDGTIKTTGLLNPQRLYGSDVISRMNNATKPRLLAKMQSQVRDAIYSTALRELGIKKWDELSRIVISGNTLMLHLFFGFDVSGMTRAPFKPFTLTFPITDWNGVRVIAIPCISTFVGGDITSGLYGQSITSSGQNILFADLGTNGEIVLKKGNSFYAASVAAGPAFEGGNISIGLPALSGAIYSVSIKKGFCRIKTISDIPPRGICGSGLIEAVYELKENNIIDAQGSYIDDDIRNEGYPLYANNINDKLTLTQDDIRAFQEAKAAVCAGILALLKVSDTAFTEIDSFILAGSFGRHLDIKKASDIGLIPKALSSKVTLAGNSSLNGAIRLARNPKDLDALTSFAKNVVSISLADSDYFKEAYITSLPLA